MRKGYRHVMWADLNLGGNRGKRHVAARVAAIDIVPLCLSWLSFFLRLSLFVSFPFTNLFLTTLSLFLLVGLLVELLERDRQESQDQLL